MIVVDTSALMAVVLRESDRDVFLDFMIAEPRKLMSAATVVEAAQVYATAFGPEVAAEKLYEDLDMLRIEIINFTDEHARLAVEAAMRFGRGRHRAKLNFGDCFSYALAKVSGLPLLFKGNDFTHTDIESALA
ncbi:type II toxin-antitoxin system VapC family toxin [Caulobacter sp. LARHSG274]